ncbi:hypothetical protein ACF3DV_32570 [Chlorogloeopsis fritschii PCC 9212]|uniref:Transmembrane protein n=1 Tax=Chlorogloeopsis fritschii PCC 6912 TaxID=211165 RepID=A0A3S1FC50_CHLFR|nr:hypothetical protein [Chlorogloeopsis fritschii]RUR75123.1 hypothetical protein PCC6912_49660 [Chlorogloeopsis fritschii PCC 6912]
MKLKFLKFLTVSLLTLIVLSPELVVLSVVWEQHMQLVETQNFMCEFNSRAASSQNTSKTAFQQECQKYAQDLVSIKIFDAKLFNSQLSLIQLYKYKIVDFLKWFFLLFPICLGILIFLYDRYLVYRATVFQRQVDILEKLWHESIEQ